MCYTFILILIRCTYYRVAICIIHNKLLPRLNLLFPFFLYFEWVIKFYCFPIAHEINKSNHGVVVIVFFCLQNFSLWKKKIAITNNNINIYIIQSIRVHSIYKKDQLFWHEIIISHNRMKITWEKIWKTKQF